MYLIKYIFIYLIYLIKINVYQVYGLIFFSFFRDYLFNLLNAYFAAQIFGLMSHLSTFAFVSCGLLPDSSNNF